jgi:hypothetical protein
MRRRALLGGLAALPLARAALAANAPVTVFEARRIVTMEPAMPSARFVAVAGGIVLGIADRLEDLAPWAHGREVRRDRSLAGSVLMPGLIDPHVHPMQSAIMLNLPFVAPDDWELPSGRNPGARNASAWWARVREKLARSKADPFICWGYHELVHGPMSRARLDALSLDRPVVIWQRNFHDVFVNSAALKAGGLDDPAAFSAALAAVKADPAHGDLARGLFFRIRAAGRPGQDAQRHPFPGEDAGGNVRAATHVPDPRGDHRLRHGHRDLRRFRDRGRADPIRFRARGQPFADHADAACQCGAA